MKMNMKQLSAAGLGLLGASLNAAHLERPNILVILADDMGYSDLGCYGSEIPTPHIDRLAVTGIRYTRFHNSARCSPTRASLLTGLYPHQTGIGSMMHDQGLPGYQGDLNENVVTIAQVLRESGYSTFLSGKWHVTKQTDMFRDELPEEERIYTSKHNWPLQRGFDNFFGTIHGAGSFFEPTTLVQGNDPVTEFPDGFYYTDAISDFAVERIRKAAEDPSRPFFGFVSHVAPHWPLHAKPEDIELFKGHYDVGWDVVRQRRLDRMKLLGLVSQDLELSPRHEGVPAWEDEPDKEWYGHAMAVYAAQMYSMDQGIGRIVEALRDTGQLENTMILFLSDNGGCAEVITERWPRSLHMPYELLDGSPVFRGKHLDRLPGPANTYASYGVGWANASNTPYTWFKHFIQLGGTLTPLVISWPAGTAEGVAGSVTDQIGHVKDFMPTFLEVANAAYPETFKGQPITPHEGISLVPNFKGEQVEPKTLYWEHNGSRGVLDGYWKLVSIRNRAWALHDLRTDPLELTDIGDSMPEVRAQLLSKYQAWADRVGVVENPPRPVRR